jgi:hypothetical protein
VTLTNSHRGFTLKYSMDLIFAIALWDQIHNFSNQLEIRQVNDSEEFKEAREVEFGRWGELN